MWSKKHVPISFKEPRTESRKRTAEMTAFFIVVLSYFFIHLRLHHVSLMTNIDCSPIAPSSDEDIYN